MREITCEYFKDNSAIKNAATICIKNKKAIMEEAISEKGYAYTYGSVDLYNNPDILAILQHIEGNGADTHTTKKLLLTDDSQIPPAQEQFTKILLMTAEEFPLFRQIAKNGAYLIAIAE